MYDVEGRVHVMKMKEKGKRKQGALYMVALVIDNHRVHLLASFSSV